MATMDLNSLMREEGGYANNHNDSGGETYAGIARNKHPNWKGWGVVDRYKKLSNGTKSLNKLLANNIEIQKMIYDFYRVNFWNPIQGDNITNDKVARNIFDFAVNAGTKRAVKMAQAVVGAAQDGVFGKKTLLAINIMDSDIFVTEFARRRVYFYQTLVKIKPRNKVFLTGWINRTRRIANA